MLWKPMQTDRQMLQKDVFRPKANIMVNVTDKHRPATSESHPLPCKMHRKLQQTLDLHNLIHLS